MADNSHLDPEIVAQMQAIIANDSTAPYSATYTTHDFDNFRPSSAQSHSASEYSFSSTDVDNDSVMSENIAAPQPNQDRAPDFGFGGMNLSLNNGTATTNHFWMDHSHNQVTRNGGINGVKRDLEWEGMGTVAPDSVSPPDQSGSAQAPSASPEKEDTLSREARLERKFPRRDPQFCADLCRPKTYQ